MHRNHSPAFLTAEWLHLAVLNFAVDPALVRPLVPEGTELDKWRDTTLISLVGFLFRDARVWGVPVPFHRNFEEVNLRFYVRRKTEHAWRRGVVFVKELAPRRAVAWMARMFYGENYSVVPMRHRVVAGGDPQAIRSAAYWWKHGGNDGCLEVTAAGAGRPAAEGSQEEFITEQYWGYSGRPGRATLEYRVEHPRWKIWPVRQARFDADIGSLYGRQFVEPLSARPASAYLVDGSAVTVYRGMMLAGR